MGFPVNCLVIPFACIYTGLFQSSVLLIDALVLFTYGKVAICCPRGRFFQLAVCSPELPEGQLAALISFRFTPLKHRLWARRAFSPGGRTDGQVFVP